jgi:hypothetical protein
VGKWYNMMTPNMGQRGMMEIGACLNPKRIKQVEMHLRIQDKNNNQNKGNQEVNVLIIER